MYKLLKSKGYQGQDNIEDIISWLNKNEIYVDFYTIWNENSSKVTGYKVVVYIKPYASGYSSPISMSYRNALEVALYKLIDYLPKN